MPTPQQVQEAIELGYDEHTIVAAAQAASAYTVEVKFHPKLTTSAQFRGVCKFAGGDRRALIGLNASSAVLAFGFTPSEVAQLKIGKVLFKVGSTGAIASAVITRIARGASVR